ncbi:hypothetical protein Hamer_G017385 [Homarus americanus]|uniref:Uncharacterized protein n=1 Tax=Homarus americanus TaxID=6706 RepID=A0A8J5JLN1_HOMAM|nr:hypothetical protein Hamer_G017385 [Homarus americanus]
MEREYFTWGMTENLYEDLDHELFPLLATSNDSTCARFKLFDESKDGSQNQGWDLGGVFGCDLLVTVKKSVLGSVQGFR